MEYKKKIRILAIVFCACFLTTGCAGEEKVVIEPMEQEEVVTFGFDFLGGKDVMPISGYNGPSPTYWSKDGNVSYDFITDEGFQKLADAGVNHISYVPWHFPASTEYANKMLELGEKYRIGITVRASLSYMDTLEKTDNFLKQYSDYESFCSVFVTDEPSSANYFASSDRMISLYVKNFEYLNQLGYFPYCNLYPLYDAKQRQACLMKRIKKMVAVLCATFCLVSFFTAGIKGMFAFAEEDGQLTEITPQDFGISGGAYTNYIGTSYQGGDTLFGTIFSAIVGQDFNRSGIIGANGAKTEFYEQAVTVNQQITAVDEVLMNCVSKDILAIGAKAQSQTEIKKTSYAELIGVTVSQETFMDRYYPAGAIIGCFDYHGKTTLYVVNNDYENAHDITMKFDGTHELSLISAGMTRQECVSECTIRLTAGDAVLVVID